MASVSNLWVLFTIFDILASLKGQTSPILHSKNELNLYFITMWLSIVLPKDYALKFVE